MQINFAFLRRCFIFVRMQKFVTQFILRYVNVTQLLNIMRIVLTNLSVCVSVRSAMCVCLCVSSPCVRAHSFCARAHFVVCVLTQMAQCSSGAASDKVCSALCVCPSQLRCVREPSAGCVWQKGGRGEPSPRPSILSIFLNSLKSSAVKYSFSLNAPLLWGGTLMYRSIYYDCQS